MDHGRSMPTHDHATTGSDSILAGRESGFSLVELMTGLMLAVLLIGGALTGIVQHQGQRRIHGEKILAMSACRSTIETLRSVDIADLPGFDGQGFDVLGQGGQPGGLAPVPGDVDGLCGEIAVTPHARSQPNNALYVVTVTARWRGAARGGTFAMQTLMGERR